MDGENAATDVPPGTGQQTDNAEANTLMDQRCNSVRSIASTNGPATPQRYAEENMQNMGYGSHDAMAAAALVQMYGTTQTGNRLQVTDSQSFPSRHPQPQHLFAPSQSRSYEGAPMCQPPAQYGLTASSYNVQHEPNANTIHNSDAELRNTVLALSRAFANMQEQQADIQQKQEHITGALTSLTTILQSMKNDSKVDNNERSTTRNLNIPPGRADHTRLGRGEPFSQQSTGTSYDEVSDVNTCRARPGISRNWTVGETQYTAEVHSPTLPPHPYQYQSQGEQMQSEAQHRQVEGNSIYQEYVQQDSTGHGTLARAEGHNTNLQRPFQNQNTGDDVPEGWEDCIPPRQRSYRGHRRSPYENRAAIPEAKLPPFSGKEEWKVWVSRFEAVAKRRNWDDNEKLDNLLPRLQGKAGEFVFSQLPPRTLADYEELVRELNSRFRVVETQKTFAAKFSQRNQRNDETVEEYAADLKRLYAKAYKKRDDNTRQEDLVRRFLDGLKDHEARFEIEFHKEPEDIDTAVFHAVNFLQTRRRSSGDNYSDRKKRYARRASQESDSECEIPEAWEETEDYEQAKRMPVQEGGSNQRRGYRSEKKTDAPAQKATQESDSLKVLTETKELVQSLVSQMAELKKPNVISTDRPQKTPTASGITCYSCRQKGHIARECPEKEQVKRGQGNSTSKSEQGKRDNTSKNHLNY